MNDFSQSPTEEEAEEPFDFAKYLVKEPVATKNNLGKETGTISLGATAAQEDQSNEPFDFGKYTVKQPESYMESAKRGIARTASRAAEAIVGLPGDIYQMSKSLANKLPEEAREPNIIQKGLGYLGEKLPTSEQLKEFTSQITSGYTDPQGAAEEFGDEISSLATMMINPGKAGIGFSNLLKNIGSSVAKSSVVKGAGKGAELLGADEKQTNLVELGTIFLTGLYGRKMADKYVGEQYQKARSMIPRDVKVETKSLSENLMKVEKELAKGVPTPTKTEVRKSLSVLKNKSAKGSMQADDLIQSVHDINEKINSKKLFDDLSTSERKLLRYRYDLVKNEVNKEVASYGKTNPEFYKTWKDANEAYATIAESKRISNWLQSKIGSMPKGLAGTAAVDLFIGSPVITGAALGGTALLKASELLYRISKSKTLQKHYTEVLREASNENTRAVIKHLEAINKESEK